VLTRKRAEEEEFKRYLAKNPDLAAKYGDVLPKMEQLYRESNANFLSNQLLEALLTNTTITRIAALAVGRALNEEKAATERSPAYSEERINAVKGSIGNQLKARNLTLERKSAELYLSRLVALSTRPASLQQRNIQASNVADFARQLMEENGLQTEESLTKLFTMSSTQLRDMHSPTIDFLLDATNELEPARKRTQSFNNSIAKLRSLYIEGITAFRKGSFYPDANRTLRFSYGEVKGYKPRDAVQYGFVTSLQGIVEKDTGKEPFDVPPILKELYEKRDFGAYADPSINDVPVAFLTTNDITGGNSGSPIINGRGELIGLVFDNNYEGLGSDYGYNAAQCRTIGVDMRYIFFLAEKMAGASHILKELQVTGKGASAAAGAGK
jgi:hypothetical protein